MEADNNLRQGSLALQAGFDEPDFAHFIIGLEQQWLLAALQDDAHHHIWLQGEAASGKSHLLQAWVRWQNQQGRACLYVSLKRQPPQELWLHMAESPALALDDVDAVWGDEQQETDLFHLYNRSQPQGRLLMASRLLPTAEQIILPDLHSRLCQALHLRLHALHQEEDLLQLLQQVFQHKGYQLPDGMLQQLLRHCPRQPAHLLHCQQRLLAYLAEHRKRPSLPLLRRFFVAGEDDSAL